MFKNYFKIALRSLLKQRFYTLINVLGLAIGLTACLLIALFVGDEMSYDTFHEKADRIQRVNMHFRLSGQDSHMPLAPAPLANILTENYPEVAAAVRFREYGALTFYQQEQAYREAHLVYADSTLFDVFTIPLLYGDVRTALTEPNSMVISRATAEKYFGSNWEKDVPLGQMLLEGAEKTPYQITGIFDKIPDNAHFHFEVFVAMSTLPESRRDEWLSNNFHTYLLLHEGADIAGLQQKINDTFIRYAAPQYKQFTGGSMEDFLEGGNLFEYSLMPLTDIHLHSNLRGELEVNSDVRYVYIFSAIAFFILLIACINFMNLSTARSSGRAKEVGVRKVMGSDRKQLIGQFLVEAMVISFFSMLIALLAVEVLLPFFNDLTNKQLRFTYVQHWYLLPVLLLAVMLVGLLAGSYPAFFLSAFQPTAVLKGKLATGMKNAWLRSTLVVVQFGASIMLMVSTVVVYQQLYLIQHKKLGFDKEHVLVMHHTGYLKQQAEAFKNELLRNPDVVSASYSGYLPANTIDNNSNGIFPDKNPSSPYFSSIPWWYVDHDYIQTMGMSIVEGRDFSRDFTTDSTAMIINEAAARHFDFDKDPEKGLGKILSSFVGGSETYKSYKVIGVVEDFHYNTMREQIGPMVMILSQNASALSIRVKPAAIQKTVAAIEARWQDFVPGIPFEYSFLDERFNNMYHAEQKVGKIFMVFCSLAIFIAALGLFGLASFTAEQRTKEIGIRKVLGASVWSVVLMFSKDFTRLVMLALLIAVPLSYYAMDQWLNDFAYRIDIGPLTFVLAGVTALLIAWLTVSFQSFKAARANPVDSLKSE